MLKFALSSLVRVSKSKDIDEQLDLTAAETLRHQRPVRLAKKHRADMTKMRKINRPIPKSNESWRWSGFLFFNNSYKKIPGCQWQLDIAAMTLIIFHIYIIVHIYTGNAYSKINLFHSNTKSYGPVKNIRCVVCRSPPMCVSICLDYNLTLLYQAKLQIIKGRSNIPAI